MERLHHQETSFGWLLFLPEGVRCCKFWASLGIFNESFYDNYYGQLRIANEIIISYNVFSYSKIDGEVCGHDFDHSEAAYK